MRALSIKQPWASLITLGKKRIENRTWKPPSWMLGERFAIHASKKLDLESFTSLHHGACGFARREWPYGTPGEFPTSAIVGVATLITYVTHPMQLDEYLPNEKQERWFFGPVGFALGSVVPITPIIEVVGRLGFWQVPELVESVIVARLAEAA